MIGDPRSGEISQPAAGTWHALRKALKKLRYGVDDLAGLYGCKEVKNYLQGCKELQALLGQMNDAVVAGALAKGLSGDDGSGLAPARLMMTANRRAAASGNSRRSACPATPAASTTALNRDCHRLGLRHQPNLAGRAGVEQVPLQHREVLGGNRDHYRRVLHGRPDSRSGPAQRRHLGGGREAGDRAGASDLHARGTDRPDGCSQKIDPGIECCR